MHAPDELQRAVQPFEAGPRVLSEGRKSPDEKQAEEEQKVEPISRPGGFNNDPEDSSNPNEVRERHLKKVDRKLNR